MQSAMIFGSTTTLFSWGQLLSVGCGGHLPFASLRIVERCFCLLFGSLTKPGLKINITCYFICFLRGPSLIGFRSSFFILVICLFYCPILDLYVMCVTAFLLQFLMLVSVIVYISHIKREISYVFFSCFWMLFSIIEVQAVEMYILLILSVQQ